MKLTWKTEYELEELESRLRETLNGKVPNPDSPRSSTPSFLMWHTKRQNCSAKRFYTTNPRSPTNSVRFWNIFNAFEKCLPFVETLLFS